jgi:DtxR family transcriptional regulator, Mn-dependent transcriptional regulator
VAARLGVAPPSVSALRHAVSGLLVERIDEALGYPRRDPHGDPIPTPSGEHLEDWSPALADTAVGAFLEVDRVSDEDGGARRLGRAIGMPLAGLVHGVIQP